MTETVKPADVSDAAWELAGFAMGWPGIAQQTLRARIAHAIDRRAPADGVREALTLLEEARDAAGALLGNGLDAYEGRRLLLMAATKAAELLDAAVRPTLSPPVQAEAVVERMAQAMWRAELDDLSPAASAVRHAALWGEESPNTQDKWRLRARAAASVLPAAPALKQEGM